MMKRETFAIATIYVPVKRRAMLDPKKAQEIAESILQVGLQSPILVRQDGERFILVEGLHRWRRASNSARKPSSDMSFRPAGINGLETLSLHGGLSPGAPRGRRNGNNAYPIGKDQSARPRRRGDRMTMRFAAVHSVAIGTSRHRIAV
jgi:hypothetical protein